MPAKLGRTPLYCKHLHRLCHSFVTVASKPILHRQTDNNSNGKQLLQQQQQQKKAGRLGFLEKADVPLAGDCLGSAGCVASTMMMYAHLPWLLASSSRG